MKILIATGGSCTVTPAFRSALMDWAPDRIIAADSGLRHLYAMDMKPDLLLGDMDSIAPEILERSWKDGLVPRVFPTHKDETDTEIALSIAREIAGEDAVIRVIGAAGDRVDHTYANLHLMNRYYRQVEFWDGRARLWILHGPAVDTVEKPNWFSGKKTAYVSLLPFGTPVQSVTLTGFEYPLNRYNMDVNAVIGTSNQLTGTQGRISFEAGSLLCSIVEE